ncbi:DUF4349 domain-containing protein [Streptosporangiaceae bacterium NEAU-GS5]|nr:DUF4349 domain-containing protein [Streptosporangiaceae bacterium NEAU-GS5]
MSIMRYGTAMTAVALLLGLVAACGGSDGSTSSEAVAPMPAYDSAARSAAGSSGGSGVAATSPAQAPDADGAAKDLSATTGKIAIAPADRAIIYTAEVSVQASDVAAASDRAKQIVTAAGGYVADEKSSTESTTAIAVLTFKIPTARYSDVLTQLGRDLGKRLSQHQGSQDVTEEVADVDSRVKSAQVTLDQFRTLLTKATKIGEVLEVEREISTREADLEALQARQKALAAQTTMATITLDLRGRPAASPKPKEPDNGFVGGLKTGWKALVKAVAVGLTVLGVLLPWLVLAAIAWGVFAVARRRVRPRRAEPRTAEIPQPVERAEAAEEEKSPSA